MSDGKDTEVLARLAHLDLAGPAFMAVVFKYRKRNIALRQGARIIKKHDGEPVQRPPIELRDPYLTSRSAHLIGGSKMQFLGFVQAVSEATAIEAAVAVRVDDQKRRRLTVNPRR
jgi:hypothetical protein